MAQHVRVSGCGNAARNELDENIDHYEAILSRLKDDRGKVQAALRGNGLAFACSKFCPSATAP
eukprot:1038857-Rhodomonas_salina.1